MNFRFERVYHIRLSAIKLSDWAKMLKYNENILDKSLKKGKGMREW